MCGVTCVQQYKVKPRYQLLYYPTPIVSIISAPEPPVLCSEFSQQQKRNKELRKLSPGSLPR
jgi:hypothetical protein